MKCPKCETGLAREHVHGVVVDRCGACHGILVDKTALVAIDSLNAGAVIDLASTMDEAADAKPAHCYECDKIMIALRGAGDIQFDWCEKCERVFFDRGELRAFDAVKEQS